jgi:hypothetical protein
MDRAASIPDSGRTVAFLLAGGAAEGPAGSGTVHLLHEPFRFESVRAGRAPRIRRPGAPEGLPGTPEVVADRSAGRGRRPGRRWRSGRQAEAERSASASDGPAGGGGAVGHRCRRGRQAGAHHSETPAPRCPVLWRSSSPAGLSTRRAGARPPPGPFTRRAGARPPPGRRWQSDSKLPAWAGDKPHALRGDERAARRPDRQADAKPSKRPRPEASRPGSSSPG